MVFKTCFEGKIGLMLKVKAPQPPTELWLGQALTLVLRALCICHDLPVQACTNLILGDVGFPFKYPVVRV